MGTNKFYDEYKLEIEGTSEYQLEKLVLDIQCQVIGRMKQLGYTQEKLAKEMGVTQPYVSQLLNKGNVQLKTLVLAAHALNTTWKPFELEPFTYDLKVAFANDFMSGSWPSDSILKTSCVHKNVDQKDPDDVFETAA